jgi:primase-polymerase (primpol)-like protein
MSGAATMLSPVCDTILEELKARSQWVVWRLELREGEPKPTKVPYCAVDRKASSTDPATWLSFEAAWALYERGGFDGVGYVFSPDDSYCGIDLDPELLEGDRQTILKRFNCYTELSPSGHGQHIIVKATLPGGGRKKGPLEVYDRARYFTITGKRMSAYPPTIEERQEAVVWLLATYFPVSHQRDTKSNMNGGGLDATDDELLARAFDATNGDKLRRLWNGDTTNYPSTSEADMALASLLAFWTGPDAARLETLMHSSGLAREKWDKRHYSDGQTHLEGVIAKALSGRTEFYAVGNHANGHSEEQRSETAPTHEPPLAYPGPGGPARLGGRDSRGA